jgi:hypothetical protein
MDPYRTIWLFSHGEWIEIDDPFHGDWRVMHDFYFRVGRLGEIGYESCLFLYLAKEDAPYPFLVRVGGDYMRSIFIPDFPSYVQVLGILAPAATAGSLTAFREETRKPKSWEVESKQKKRRKQKKGKALPPTG